jgi:hypothetical protein
MKWMVTFALRSGGEVTIEVYATNREDAEYRAAMLASDTRGSVERVIACRRAR